MVLVSIICFGGVRCLQGPQDAPYLILAVWVAGNPDFRIQMNREGSDKIFTCQSLWTTTLVSDFFIWPFLQRAILFIRPSSQCD